jgi:hypothetical protein
VIVNGEPSRAFTWTGCLRSIARALSVLIGLYLIVGAGLVWAAPHTIILLTVAAIIWYFTKTGEWAHFRLRSLFVVMTAVAIVVATMVYVPSSMLGAWSGISTERVVIEVVDATTRAPLGNTEVMLTSRAANKALTQQRATNAEGIAVFDCPCAANTRKSILRTWTTYRTDGWSVQVKAAGYDPVNEVLSDIVVEGEGEGPINFRISLQGKR